jgi:hypothetical protein
MCSIKEHFNVLYKNSLEQLYQFYYRIDSGNERGFNFFAVGMEVAMYY